MISLFDAHAKLPTLVATRLQRWALTLSAYNYKIEYRTGANNGNAEPLSRKPLVQTNLDAQTDDNNVLNIETIPFNVLNDNMVRETHKDRILSVVYDCLLKCRELPQSAEFCLTRELKISSTLIRNSFSKPTESLFQLNCRTKYCKCFTVSIWAFRRQRILLDIMFGGPKLMKISSVLSNLANLVS